MYTERSQWATRGIIKMYTGTGFCAVDMVGDLQASSNRCFRWVFSVQLYCHRVECPQLGSAQIYCPVNLFIVR